MVMSIVQHRILYFIVYENSFVIYLIHSVFKRRYAVFLSKTSRKIELVAKSEMIAYGAYRQISLHVLHKTATASRLSRMSDKEPKYALKPHF
jgi:hypothetical protein